MFTAIKAYFAKREATKRRNNYEEIKALIVQRHLDGFGGVVLPKKYDAKDLACFKPPMYQPARTEDNKPVIFWRKDLMTVEVGEPKKQDSTPEVPSNVIPITK